MSNCPNCGAPIRRTVCEYCGTPFVDHKSQTVDLKDRIQYLNVVSRLMLDGVEVPLDQYEKAYNAYKDLGGDGLANTRFY